MTLKLSKTAVRELTRLYRGILIVGLTCLTMTANNAMAAITETDLTNYTLKTATNEQTNQIATVDAITEEMGALLAQKEANISNTLGFDITNNPANTDVPNSLVSQLTGEAAGNATSVVGAINALDGAITEAKELAEEKASTAETNAKAYTNELANGAVATNTDAIAENTAAISKLNGDENTDGSIKKIASGYANTAEANATTYTNAQIAAAKTYAEEKANTAETKAKDYTDTQVADAKTYAEEKANTALTEAEDYTDTQVADAKTYAEEKANTALTEAEDYTDTQVANAKTYAEEKATAAETNAKAHTDTLIGTTDVFLVEQNGVMAVNTVNENIVALNNTIGDITNLNQYTEGSAIGNALTQGGTQSADTVVAALHNIDATLGTIHGLRDKLAASGAGTNLASGTTVEQHLTALDSAIGNRAYTSTRYITSGSDLSTAVSALDSNLSRVEGNLDALTNRTNKMHHEMKSGFASLAAMSALVPNARVAGDTQISVGTGHYRGTTGFALGAFHHVNDNVLLNAGAAYGGNGSATFKGGVTFGW